MRHLLLAIAVALVASAAPTPVHAASPEACAPDAAPDKYRMLRQLTLDLYGRIPTYDEYVALDGRDDLDTAAIDAMFSTDEYYAGVRDYFRHLIWGGLPDDLNVIGSQRLVSRAATTNLHFVGNLRTTFRARNDVICLDQLQTLAERTCNRRMLERFSQLPGVDQQRIAATLVLLDVMEP